MNEHASGRDHVLIVDSGDFIPGTGLNNELKAEHLLKGMKKISYDAINLGERDFLLGVNVLLKLKKMYDLPIISANVFHADSTTLVTEPYVIKKFKARSYGDSKLNSLKVGIFGVMMQRSTLVISPDEPKLVTKDPFEIARDVVKKLRGKCDVIIALAHMSTMNVNKLADEIDGIDIVIGGHDYMRRCNLSAGKQVIMLQTGTKGQYIGDLKVNLDNDNQITSHDGKIITLDKQIKDDPDLNKLADEYDNAYQKLIKGRAKKQ